MNQNCDEMKCDDEEKSRKTAENKICKYVDLSIYMYQVRGHSEYFLHNFLVMRQQQMHFESYSSFRESSFRNVLLAQQKLFAVFLYQMHKRFQGEEQRTVLPQLGRVSFLQYYDFYLCSPPLITTTTFVADGHSQIKIKRL